MCSKARETKREHFMYLCLAVGTGMRPFEILKITPMMLDYSYKQGLFIEGKQGKERVVPLHDALYSELKAYISEMKIRKTETLFSFQDRTIRRFVKRYASEVGVSEHLQKDIKPYTFRHYFNTIMRKNKIDDQIRKMIVGHNLDYSEGYVHIEWEEQLTAVNSVFKAIPL
ncbi:MAG: putative tyrosine recombinase XerC-like protein [Candidatus Methanofastidiosum methylothiophilum]|uniref:Putative tyrosine recombinase XerC-like protein n=1 Tax=Candidatus Methanofastidiosum methylothiophilum TaxID=1705564 RepID=A0A150IHM7_9EURY|nr:MAG: putative tyrosine recombinase XerC-like protein [Candidatus Methanofastidiosum methylthiophilus]